MNDRTIGLEILNQLWGEVEHCGITRRAEGLRQMLEDVLLRADPLPVEQVFTASEVTTALHDALVESILERIMLIGFWETSRPEGRVTVPQYAFDRVRNEVQPDLVKAVLARLKSEHLPTDNGNSTEERQ